MSDAFENPSQEQIFQYLKEAKTIAVVGISDKIDRTSYLIAQGLQKNGYRLALVNPILAGKTVLGEKVYEKLQDIPQEAEQILRAARRNKIVMNRCIKIEYAYSGLGKK